LGEELDARRSPGLGGLIFCGFGSPFALPLGLDASVFDDDLAIAVLEGNSIFYLRSRICLSRFS
jgi:hypothetical protein